MYVPYIVWDISMLLVIVYLKFEVKWASYIFIC